MENLELLAWLSRNPVLFYSIGGIVIALTIASIVTFALNKAKPQSDFTELNQRIRSWWVMVIIFTFAMAISRTISIAFFAFISYLALKEYFSLITTRRADRRVLFWAYLSVPLQYLWVYMGWYGMFIIFIPVYMFLFLPLKMVLKGETKGFLQAAGTLHWGVMLTVFCISHVSYLLILPGEGSAMGATLVLYLVVLTQANDVFQYIWGKMLGKHKALPTVSPGKTIEGLLGGVVSTIALATVLGPLLTPMSLTHSFLAGIIISLAGFIGDVNVSALKRDLGVKDSGSLLPGHGGILDRIDSLSYTAPLFFHFVYYIYY